MSTHSHFARFAPRKINDPAVVLLSGGLDSATVLAMVKNLGYVPYALSFRYGQRHSSELDAASILAKELGAVRHEIIDLDLSRFGGSALTDLALELPTTKTNTPHQNIPITYVPARNTIMLSCALGWMEALNATDIFFGANAVDYSGYPDCRPEYVNAFAQLANLATRVGVEEHSIRVHAPIIHMSKGEIIQTGISFGVDFSKTVSCYQANNFGHACGICESCRLRKIGFEQAHITDPTLYQTNHG
jgi:7-cyano-7-deazaguanine synthase